MDNELKNFAERHASAWALRYHDQWYLDMMIGMINDAQKTSEDEERLRLTVTNGHNLMKDDPEYMKIFRLI